MKNPNRTEPLSSKNHPEPNTNPEFCVLSDLYSEWKYLIQRCRWSRNGTGVTVRFMVGRPANDSGSGHRQRALVKEQADHGDLVQFDFVDTYWNLTLKGVRAMQWLNDYCASTRSATLPIKKCSERHKPARWQ